MKSIMKASAVVLAVTLSGCGPMIAARLGIPVVDPNDQKAVAAHVKTTFDQHKGTYTTLGPIIFTQRDGFGEIRVFGHTYLLRTWSPDGEYDPEHLAQLYVTAKVKDWAFLKHAYSNGRRLHLVQIDREVITCAGSDGCALQEVVGVNLKVRDLESLASKGPFSVKFSGRRGSLVINVPAAYISGFMSVLKKKPSK